MSTQNVNFKLLFKSTINPRQAPLDGLPHHLFTFHDLILIISKFTAQDLHFASYLIQETDLPRRRIIFGVGNLRAFFYIGDTVSWRRRFSGFCCLVHFRLRALP